MRQELGRIWNRRMVKHWLRGQLHIRQKDSRMFAGVGQEDGRYWIGRIFTDYRK